MLLISPPLSHQHCCCTGRLQYKGPLLGPRTTSLAYALTPATAASTCTSSTWQPRLKQRSSRCVVASAGQASAEQLEAAGSVLARMITQNIKGADSLAVLEGVVQEWGGSFDNIHVAAALAMLAKLPGGRSAQRLLSCLNKMWQQQLPEAGSRALANVLWAWARLGAADSELWHSTLAAFVDYTNSNGAGVTHIRCNSHDCANVLWACAKLRRPPSAEQLQVMLEALGCPEVLKGAAPQAVPNAVWAVSQFRTMRDFQADISPQLVQQLLGKDQVHLVAYEGTALNVSNLLLGLARLATGPEPLLSLDFAQDCAKQLVAAAKQKRLSKWDMQAISISMCACAQLKLPEVMFVEASSRAMPECLPFISIDTIGPVALACARLQHRDAAFMAQLLRRGTQLCKHQPRSSGKAIASDGQTAEMTAELAVAVAALDLRQLAGDVTSLVSSSGIKQQHNTHPAILRRLFQVHVWLRRHQLLDGRGLSGLLTEQQLQQGAQEAAGWGGKGR